MNVIYDICLIRMSEVTTTKVTVPRWEVPVLGVLHGDNLQVVDQIIIERAVPNPADEFTRLVTRYGPKNEDVPAVGAVYGQFGPGIAALRKEMLDALTADDAPPEVYKTPDERKAEAEIAASKGGMSLVEEAQARDAAHLAVHHGGVVEDLNLADGPPVLESTSESAGENGSAAGLI